MFKPKIVQFKDGTYGIRKWFFGYYFFDIRYIHHKNLGFWIYKAEDILNYAKFYTLKEAQEILALISNKRDYGKVIKDKGGNK